MPRLGQALASITAEPKTPENTKFVSLARQSAKPTEPAPFESLTHDYLETSLRLNIARAIPEAKDLSSILAMLDHTPAPGTEEAWYVVFNQILNGLAAHSDIDASLVDKLIAILRDPDRPYVIRDYAIQFLCITTVPLSPPHAEAASRLISKRSDALAAIAEAVQVQHHQGNSIPGTALLVLTEASSRLPNEATAHLWENLTPYLRVVLTGDLSITQSNRVSAIQAVSRMRLPEFLPTIRQLAVDEKAHPSIRLSSIAALGFYADSQDQALLQSIASQNDSFQYAAKSGLEKFPQP
jgi:hypothetical protein